MIMDAAKVLAQEIRNSPEYREYAAAKEALSYSDSAKALIKEYRRMQVAIQMGAMAGSSVPADDMQRFSQISSLLYGGTDTSRYLIAELQLQRMMGDVFKLLTDAADIQFDMPGAP